MAGPFYFDRVKDSSTTTGSGTLTLANSAPTGFRTFGSVLANGDTCFYALVLQSGAEWETGIGTYTVSGTTLARTQILASSNSGAAVSFSSGTKDVFITHPAAQSQFMPVVTQNTFATARPTYPKTGDIYVPTNGVQTEFFNGTAWVPYGPAFPFTKPVDGDFAWVNQGSAAVDTTYGGIYLSAPTNGGSQGYRIRKKAAPATPYTITAAFLGVTSWVASFTFAFGLCFRQSSDGKLHTFDVAWNASAHAFIISRKMTDASTLSANYQAITGAGYPGTGGGVIWQRIADNGTNRILSLSANGRNWVDVHTIGRTDFLTADEVGIFVNPFTGAGGAHLLSWEQG